LAVEPEEPVQAPEEMVAQWAIGKEMPFPVQQAHVGLPVGQQAVGRLVAAEYLELLTTEVVAALLP